VRRKTGRRKGFLEFLKQEAIYPLNEIFILWRPPWLSSLKNKTISTS
jgi:hypothetical protein